MSDVIRRVVSIGIIHWLRQANIMDGIIKTT